MKKSKWQILIKTAVIFSVAIAFFLTANTSKAVDVGMCGSASGTNTYTIPTTNLCSAGTAGPITLTTINPNVQFWGWNCIGTLSSSGCSAMKKVDGACADVAASYTAPASGLCVSGTASSVSGGSGTNPWTWACYGVNGGTNATNCSALKKIDGICAVPPDTYSYPSWPGFTTLCSAGYCPSGTTVFGTGPWTWTCCGYNGGARDDCQANKTGCLPTWSPDPSNVCSGVGFNQINSCDGSTRPATGTSNPTIWSPDPSTVCSGVEFIQTNGCTNRSATGTKACADPTICGVPTSCPLVDTNACQNSSNCGKTGVIIKSATCLDNCSNNIDKSLCVGAAIPCADDTGTCPSCGSENWTEVTP